MPKVSGLIVPNLYPKQRLHADGCVSVVLFYKCKKAGEIASPCRKFIYIWKQKNWIYEVEGEPDTYEKIY